jgi:DNA-binding beta-propeller fold protein YncE
VLFECLTGTSPFRNESELGVLFAHLEEPAPRASDRRAELPATVDEAIARGLAKVPGERFESCQELIAHARSAFALAPRRRSRRRALAGLAAAIGVVCAAVAVLLTHDSGPAQRSATIRRIDPGSGRVSATFPVSQHPGRIAVGGGQLWTVDLREGTLWRLDTARGDLVRIPSVGNPRDVAILGGTAYVADDSFATFSGNVTRYDAATGQREGGLALLACSIAAGDGVVWAAGCPAIQRLSTGGATVRVVAHGLIPLPARRSAGNDRTLLADMAVGAGALWVLGDATDPRVWKVDRVTGRILATTRMPFAPRSLAAGIGGVWVTGGIADRVAHLDARDGRILGILHVGRGASGITTGGGRVWVVSALAGELAEIDPRSARVVRTLRIGGLPREVAYADHALWVTGDGR